MITHASHDHACKPACATGLYRLRCTRTDAKDERAISGFTQVASCVARREVSALFMEQLMLYRDTRDSILAGQPAQAW